MSSHIRPEYRPSFPAGNVFPDGVRALDRAGIQYDIVEGQVYVPAWDVEMAHRRLSEAWAKLADRSRNNAKT